MLSIAVCDDNMLDCCNIARKIKSILEGLGEACIIHQFYSGKELLQTTEKFDIIFLDIIMQDVDGMQTAEFIRKKAFDKILIFMSSSREYVFDAYDVEAFQYLLKPIDDRKLKSTLQRIVSKSEGHSQDFIIVNKERQRTKLFLEDIYYFEIKGRLIYVHEADRTVSYYEQMGVLERNLQEKDFFRCHKSYLINLKYVDSYNRQEVILDNGERIMIAKRRYEDFCRKIIHYMKRSGGIL